MAFVPQQNLYAYQGDDWSFPAVITPQGGGSIVGCRLWMTIKRARSQADDDAIVQLDTGDGSIVIDDSTHATFTITAAQLATMSGRYVYDVQIRTVAGKLYTALQGSFLVTDQVTRATGA